MLKWSIIFILAVALLASCSSSTQLRSNDPRITSILETAEALQGTPYCYAGSTTKCFDCSGFVNYCFDKVNMSLPRTSRELFKAGRPITDDEIVPGDLVFFNTNGKAISHVGIYTGNGQFIHASTSNGVMTSPLSDRYWAPRYVGARRFMPE
jgi:cell wall-associated NlpC family hydrolase